MRKCGSSNTRTEVTTGTFQVDVVDLNWGVDRFCSVRYPEVLSPETTSVSYSVSADLFLFNVPNGHLGLMFNVIDSRNYEWFYLRYVINF